MGYGEDSRCEGEELHDVMHDVCRLIDELESEGYDAVHIAQALVYASAIMLVRNEINEDWAAEQLVVYAQKTKAAMRPVEAAWTDAWLPRVPGEA